MQLDQISSDAIATPLESVTGQSTRVAVLNARFAESSPLQILDAAINELFPKRISLVSSFGAESALVS